MSPLLRILPVLGLLVVSSKATDTWRFDFGTEATSTDWIAVTADAAYDDAKGWGWLPSTRQASLIDIGTGDPITGDALCSTADAPLSFSVRVPSGNHRVTIVYGDPSAAADTSIKVESRRLQLLNAQTRAREQKSITFNVNTRTPALTPPPVNAPGLTQVALNNREHGVRHWNDRLEIEFCGARPVIASLIIEPAPSNTPTLFLLGDSTVTDQPGEPAAGWGQMLPLFFSEKACVANHAESGETLKSFIMEGRLAKVLESVHAGDYAFIQFGHNDSKTQWPQTYVAPETTYVAYLAALIEEFRLRGAVPILVTSMHRKRFDAKGRVVDTHGAYPPAVRRLAAEKKVPLIDLHLLSAQFMEALGPQACEAAFVDGTHHSNYGGYSLARLVVSEIRKQVPELASLLNETAPDLDPSPLSPESLHFPASASFLKEAPRGN